MNEPPAQTPSTPPEPTRERRRRRSRETGERVSKKAPADRAAIVVFALLIAGGALAFGAGDRLVQVALLALFSLGLFLRPPEVVRLSPMAGKLVLVLAGVMVLKEFAPAALFGSTSWRATLAAEFGIDLPWTHHPEPGRAIDALLACSLGTLWFLWVRTLAASRENRPLLAWSMFGAAAVVAAVSFATRGIDPQAIYGLRFTPGWRGFGPFPNRNHTACFLAMGTVIGFGCLAWAGVKRKYLLLGLGVGMGALTLAGLMATQSRGGLLALGVGCAIYAILLVSKLRSRRALALIAAAGLAAGALVLAFGGPLFTRFTAASSEVSNLTRVQVWSDTLGMWRDAPLFGHGGDAFRSVFPMYQKIQLDNQVVLHPESSWLKWLVELGLAPVLLALAGLLICLPGQVRAAFARRHGFYLVAAGLAGGGALLAHSAIDVPAHRWGTAALALAALALGMAPAQREDGAELEWNLQSAAWQRAARRAGLVPLGVAAFWMLPFLADWPAWSPPWAARLIAKATGEAGVSTKELDAGLAAFPLNAHLHQLRGFQELQREQPDPEIWQRHFRAALRLSPGSWSLAVLQARACEEASPSVAIELWQEAVARGGMRSHELLGMALDETGGFPGAKAAWSNYVKANPSLSLAYARRLPPEEGVAFYDRWWRERGNNPAVMPEGAELRTFYELAPQWSTREQFEEWMRRHASRLEDDYRAWAAVLHAWQDDEAAWRMLGKRHPDPDWARAKPVLRVEQMEYRWRQKPENMVNAQLLATAYHQAGEKEKAREVVVATAARTGAPGWFIRKAAHLLAAEGKLSEAVEILLREGK